MERDRVSAQPQIAVRLPGPDLLRGLAVAGMLVVNHPASFQHVFRPFSHARWHGLLGADLVFPLFLFVVGFSVALAAVHRRPTAPAVLLRGLVLFLIGVALNALPFPGWESLRFPGVLQRIAVVYLIVAAVSHLRSQAIAALIGILLSVQLAVHIWGAPGLQGTGWDIGNNPAGELDRLVFRKHVWRHSPDGDPEGILSTLGAIATGLGGLLAGRHGAYLSGSVFRLLGLALFFGVLGILGAAIVPINKHLWTATFALLTAAVALGLFAAAEQAARRPQLLGWLKPLLALGRRALPIYVGAIALERVLRALPAGGFVPAGVGTPTGSVHTALAGHFLGLFTDPRLGSFAWSLAYLAFWVIVALLIEKLRARPLIRAA